jgi:hypothetical protein
MKGSIRILIGFMMTGEAVGIIDTVPSVSVIILGIVGIIGFLIMASGFYDVLKA